MNFLCPYQNLLTSYGQYTKNLAVKKWLAFEPICAVYLEEIVTIHFVRPYPKLLSISDHSVKKLLPFEPICAVDLEYIVFFSQPNFITLTFFHPDISKNVPKMVLFMLYQGVWGLQHTGKSALQPLVFKHGIDIRCYVTNVADCYAYCFNQLSCL